MAIHPAAGRHREHRGLQQPATGVEGDIRPDGPESIDEGRFIWAAHPLDLDPVRSEDASHGPWPLFDPGSRLKAHEVRPPTPACHPEVMPHAGVRRRQPGLDGRADDLSAARRAIQHHLEEPGQQYRHLLDEKEHTPRQSRPPVCHDSRSNPSKIRHMNRTVNRTGMSGDLAV